MVNEAGFVPLDLSNWSIAVEKCDLCGYSKRPFYCKSCVKNGNFCYSTTLYHRPVGDISESTLNTPYHVKHKLWCEVKVKNEELRSKMDIIFSSQETIRQKKMSIEEKKVRLKFLKENLNMLESSHKEAASEVLTTKNRNQKTYQDTVLTKAKIAKISEHMAGVREKFPRLEKEVASVKSKVVLLRRGLIQDVVNEIFPISMSVASSDSLESLANSTHRTINMLRDASRTAYIQGRWVYADSGWDQMYQVLTATLPGNGDYAGCWSVGGMSETIRSPGELQVSPTLNITAGLSFLNHMVQVFASILDIRLPFRLPLKEFYRLDLTEQLFNRAVCRLNKNVATLCFYQNVDRKKLHGLHTVINILALITAPDLGRDSPQMVSRPYSEERMNYLTVGDSIFECYENDFEDDNDDEETLVRQQRVSSDMDWEYVPSGIPNHRGLEPSTNEQSYFSSAVASTSGVASIVTSFWRVIGGSGDR